MVVTLTVSAELAFTVSRHNRVFVRNLKRMLEP